MTREGIRAVFSRAAIARQRAWARDRQEIAYARHSALRLDDGLGGRGLIVAVECARVMENMPATFAPPFQLAHDAVSRNSLKINCLDIHENIGVNKNYRSTIEFK